MKGFDVIFLLLYDVSMNFSKSRLARSIILICDDDADVLAMLAEAFVDAGGHVVTATGSEEAWSLLQKNKVNCVLSDIRMSDGNGIDLAKKIRAQFKDIPLFLMTGFQDYKGSKLQDIGVEEIFFKPFVIEDIVETVALKLESM